MSKYWEIKKFGDVCLFVRGPFGGSLKKDIFKPSGYAVYEQQHAIYDQFSDIRYFVDEDKYNEMQRFELFAGDLIMSCSGTMGKIAIVPKGIQPGIINQALLKLTPNSDLLPKFLKLWMESRNFQSQIEELSQGAAIKNMASVKILKEIKVPIPTLNEQKRIVSILEQTFINLENARVTALKNLENAQELFESEKKALFDNLSLSAPSINLTEVCSNIFAGGDAPKENMSKSKTDKYTIPIYANAVKDSGLYGYTDKARVTSPSVTIAARGSGTGHTEIRYEPFLPIVRLIVLSPDTEKLNVEYFYYAIRNLEIFRSGSAIPQLTVPMIKNYRIPLPSLAVQLNAIDKLKSLESSIGKLKQVYSSKIDCLNELQASLLHKAFRGELTQSKGAAA